MLRTCTPCDDGICPYDAQYNRDCEYWCGAEEPQDNIEEWLEEDEGEDVIADDYEDEIAWLEEEEYNLEMGFDPYMGCYSDDC